MLNNYEKLIQNISRFRSLNYGENPKYIIINPKILYEIKQFSIGNDEEISIRYEKYIKTFRGIQLIESLDVEDFYLVKEFINEYYEMPE